MIDTIITAAGLIYVVGKDALLAHLKNKGDKKEQDEYKKSTRTVSLNFPSESAFRLNGKKKDIRSDGRIQKISRNVKLTVMKSFTK